MMTAARQSAMTGSPVRRVWRARGDGDVNLAEALRERRLPPRGRARRCGGYRLPQVLRVRWLQPVEALGIAVQDGLLVALGQLLALQQLLDVVLAALVGHLVGV